MIITACLVGILFFITACLQIGLYVGSVPMETLSSYLPGLVMAGWPLAVAAIIFVLIDIRLNMEKKSPTFVMDEEEIREAPARRPAAAPKQSSAYSYYAAAAPGAATPPAASPAAPPAVPQTQQLSSLFVSPPPFQQAIAPTVSTSPSAAAQPAAAAQPKENADNGLSFFKV